MLEAQESYNKELQVISDNDAYTFNLFRDQYYSNGLFIRFRYLLDSGRNEKISKRIRTYSLNHRIYTPRLLTWPDASLMDRPYAGQAAVEVSNEYYLKSNTYWKLALELGWMGPALGTGDLQEFWHQILGMQIPQGWQFEIGDAPIINLYSTLAKPLIIGEATELISESNIALGTTFNYIRQEFVWRIGSSRAPIASSMMYNGVLGSPEKKKEMREFFFFLSPGLEYVFHNSTIEGNFLGASSVYTEERVARIIQMRVGIMMSWNRFDMSLIYHYRTNETTEAEDHQFVRIKLSGRF